MKPLQKHKRKVDKAYLAAVAEVGRRYGCSVCGARPVEIHHKRRDRAYGKKADDDQTFPACWNHHVGNEGVETMALDEWEARFGTEDYHIERTRRFLRIRRDHATTPPQC